MRFLLMGGCLAAVAAGVLGAEKIEFREDFSEGLRSIWRKVEFESETKHSVEKDGTNSVLKATAQNSASGLGVKFEGIDPRGAKMTWRWKIDRIPPGGSDTVKNTFDHTARLYVAFKTRIGPPRTINYVWANTVPPGKTFHHPSSGRARFVVLQSGNAKAGQWLTEKRDLAADWKQLFGDDDVPEIVSLGFMTDSDGTRSTVTGWYDDIRLERTQR
jgi:hypothetical protein